MTNPKTALLKQTEIEKVNGGFVHTLQNALAAVRIKIGRTFLTLAQHPRKFSLARYLRTRRAVLYEENLFDLSIEELRTREFMGPFALNLYKIALVALAATAVAWLISWDRQVVLNTRLGLMQARHALWMTLLFDRAVLLTTLYLVPTALVAPVVALFLAIGTSRYCLHRPDISRAKLQRCRRAFVYFDAAYGLFPQILFSAALVLCVNLDWLILRIGEINYSPFKFLIGFPLGVAGFWPGYVLLVEIPRRLFDINGYGEPEGVVSAAAVRPRPWMRFLGANAITVLVAIALAKLALPGKPAFLPRPSGPFAVGRVVYDWTNPSRHEILAQFPVDTPREILVHVWYPASPKPGTATADYFPDARRVAESPFGVEEGANWGEAWPMIIAGNVHTQAYENAPVVRGDTRFPLIIFSHGYRIEPFGYTHQIQELVSHGYVVATIHHTYDVGVAAFPDGRIIGFSDDNRRRYHMYQSPENFLEYRESRIDEWAADIRFTLDQITLLNTAPRQAAPFAGHIDLDRVGVFGHAFGGLAAARACQLDPRITACLNQNGTLMDGPILRDKHSHMPVQPFMFVHGLFGLTTEALMKRELMIGKDLEDCYGIAYEVTLPNYDYSEFTDRPLLEAVANHRDTSDALKSLQTIEAYTGAFFDKFLKGAHGTVLDIEPPIYSEIQIKRYH